MTRRSVLLGVLAWACVVTVASAITWSVINAAGDQVLSGDDTMPALPAVSQAVQQSAGPPESGHRSRGPATTSPSTSARRSPSTGRSPGSPPSTDGSWQGVGGVVSARCTGRSIALQSATPNDGYRVEVGSRGPAEVEVKFERATGHEMQLRAVCFQGAPSFREVSGARDD